VFVWLPCHELGFVATFNSVHFVQLNYKHDIGVITINSPIVLYEKQKTREAFLVGIVLAQAISLTYLLISL